MKLGILQFSPALGRVGENLKTIRRYLIRRKFDLAVLPELATTGYNFANRKQLSTAAENKSGSSFQLFEELAVKTGGGIVWGVAEKAAGSIYNSAVLTTPEGDHHIYRKMHLFYREKLIFDPGHTGFKVIRWRGIRIGLMICFDWVFPEAARTLALKGCQIICHPSNLVMPYCQDAMITRSVENRLFCATANRTGRERNAGHGFIFTGLSQVTSPAGERVLRFSRTEQAFKTVKINPEISDTKKVNRFNDLFADRRADYYTL
jgi:predicted amidohydrolase